MIIGTSYPLRPELAESLFMLSTAIPDDIWLDFGRDMVHNINAIARVVCHSFFFLPCFFGVVT